MNILEKNVKVSRDKNGIPTVEAENDSDLYKAQGYIHAQDRLFQMDLARRQASGRLSEVVGEAALENDNKFHIVTKDGNEYTLGFVREVYDSLLSRYPKLLEIDKAEKVDKEWAYNFLKDVK